MNMTQRKSPSAAKILQVRNGQDGITPDMTRSELAASVVCKSPLLVASAMQKYAVFGNEMQLTDLARELRTLGNEMANGDLAHLERMLTHQTVLLNAIFANLAQTAMNCELMKSMETYLRLGLKAQAQARATAEALALLKNPAPYIRQANIAAGHQQVNNYAGAGKTETAPNQLLEVTDGERLDPGTAATTSGGDPAMEAVGAVNRPQD